MWKLSWKQRVNNTGTSKKMKKVKGISFLFFIVNTLMERKMSYLGQALRNEKYEQMQLVTEEKVEERRGLRKRRKS